MSKSNLLLLYRSVLDVVLGVVEENRDEVEAEAGETDEQTDLHYPQLVIHSRTEQI